MQISLGQLTSEGQTKREISERRKERELIAETKSKQGVGWGVGGGTLAPRRENSEIKHSNELHLLMKRSLNRSLWDRGNNYLWRLPPLLKGDHLSVVEGR